MVHITKIHSVTTSLILKQVVVNSMLSLTIVIMFGLLKLIQRRKYLIFRQLLCLTFDD